MASFRIGLFLQWGGLVPERGPSFRVIGRSVASGLAWNWEFVRSLHLNASGGVAF